MDIQSSTVVTYVYQLVEDEGIHFKMLIIDQ